MLNCKQLRKRVSEQCVQLNLLGLVVLPQKPNAFPYNLLQQLIPFKQEVRTILYQYPINQG